MADAVCSSENPASDSVSLLFHAVNIFDDSCVNIVFVQSHLYLHRRRICSDLHMAEMVKEEQDTKTDANGIGDLQNSKVIRGLSGDLSIDVLEQAAQIYIVVKSHDRESCAEKGC